MRGDCLLARHQLLEGLRLRRVAHPVEAADHLAHGQGEVLHHLLHAGLGFRREVLLDVLPAQGLTEKTTPSVRLE
jgi:hypothetical protein